MKTSALLREHPCFCHFSADQLDRLDDALSSARLPAGSVLFHTGVGADFYALLSGSARLDRSTALGEFTLRDLAPLRLFGTGGFLKGEYGADAELLEDSDVLTFDAAQLRASASLDHPFELALYWSLWKSLSIELREANERLEAFFAGEANLEHVTPPEPPPLDAQEAANIGSRLGVFREQHLSAMEVNFLATLSHQEQFAPGQTIFREGEDGEKIYVVAEGKVMISKNFAGVGEEALAFMGRGDFFGEMAVIDHEPRSADARAHPQVGATVLSVPSEVLNGILDIHKVSSIRLLKLLCDFAAKRVLEVHEKLVGWFLLAGGNLEVGNGATFRDSP